MQKKQRAATVSSLPWMACMLFGSSPEPCYRFNWLKVRIVASAFEQAHAGSTRTTASSSAQKCANTGLVDRKRSRHDRITGVDATHNRVRAHSGLVAALAAASEVTVVGKHCVKSNALAESR